MPTEEDNRTRNKHRKLVYKSINGGFYRALRAYLRPKSRLNFARNRVIVSVRNRVLVSA